MSQYLIKIYNKTILSPRLFIHSYYTYFTFYFFAIFKLYKLNANSYLY